MYIEPNNLPDVLRQLRRERGLSLRNFSDVVGISHAYLNKLEKGEDYRTGKPIAPTIDTLVKISEGLGIPTKKFLNMCGYFEGSLSAREPYEGADINIDTEISSLIAQLTSGASVIVGETRISTSAKEILCEELRHLLIKIRKDYDTESYSERPLKP